MQNPRTAQKVAETIGNRDGHYSYVETGIETASPRLIEKTMPGKVKPFKPYEWPDIVKGAIGVLNDNSWIVCATMITGLPEETEDDIMKSLELVDDLKKYRCFIWK